MAGLESTLTIGAVDATAAAFASIASRVDALQAQIARVDAISPSVMQARAAAGGFGSFAPPGAALKEHAAALEQEAAGAAQAAEQVGLMTAASMGFVGPAVAFAAAAVAAKEGMEGLNQAFERAHEATRGALAGENPYEIERNQAAAAEIAARHPSIQESDASHILAAARTATDTEEGVKALAESLARLRVVMQVANPKASSDELNEQVDNIVKTLKLAGVAGDPSKVGPYLEEIAKGLNAYGDLLKSDAYLAAMRAMRAAAPVTSERFATAGIAAFGSEMGGKPFGAAVAGLNRVLAGEMTPEAAREFYGLGLIAPEDMIFDKAGAPKSAKPGAHVEGWQLAQSDPDLWYNQLLGPHLAAHGITAPGDVEAKLIALFANRQAQALIEQIAANPTAVADAYAKLSRAHGLDAAEIAARTDPGVAGAGMWNALKGKVANLFSGTAIAGVEAAITDQIIGGKSPEAQAEMADLARRADEARRAARLASVPGRSDLMARFPGAFGAGSAEEDIARLSRHGIEESYRWQDTRIADPEAARGAALMGLGERGKVELDPNSKAEITINVHVDASSELLHAVAAAQAASAGSVDAHIGRMDSDAAPHRAGGIGHM
jgi:hypothetical protein